MDDLGDVIWGYGWEGRRMWSVFFTPLSLNWKIVRQAQITQIINDVALEILWKWIATLRCFIVLSLYVFFFF